MIRIVHYINQFFGQVGGEEKAGVSPSIVRSTVGPGLLLNSLFKGRGSVVATIICGDNFFAEHTEEATRKILEMVAKEQPDILIAGPAFNAGRYGIACGEICKRAKSELGLLCVTGMFPENPGVDLYKRHVYIVRTVGSAVGMRDAMSRMSTFAAKLISGERLGKPDEEGYISQEVKRNVVDVRMASARALDMLLKKMKGEAFKTEIPFSDFGPVMSAPPISDLKTATVALVTEGGLVPMGNPDNLPYARATRYEKYSIGDTQSLDPEHFMTVHRGIDRKHINEKPNRLLPVDAIRELELEGAFKKLFPYYFVTTGVATTMANATKIGAGIAKELKEHGVSAAILTATWGTGTRCGAVLTKEIERAGIPAVLITTLVPIAQTVGANRIVQGAGITHPMGDPGLCEEEEKLLRKRLLKEALRLLTIPVEQSEQS